MFLFGFDFVLSIRPKYIHYIIFTLNSEINDVQKMKKIKNFILRDCIIKYFNDDTW